MELPYNPIHEIPYHFCLTYFLNTNLRENRDSRAHVLEFHAEEHQPYPRRKETAPTPCLEVTHSAVDHWPRGRHLVVRRTSTQTSKPRSVIRDIGPHLLFERLPPPPKHRPPVAPFRSVRQMEGKLGKDNHRPATVHQQGAAAKARTHNHPRRGWHEAEEWHRRRGVGALLLSPPRRRVRSRTSRQGSPYCAAACAARRTLHKDAVHEKVPPDGVLTGPGATARPSRRVTVWSFLRPH